MTLTKHTAPGQAAGYLFQPDRVLYWLAHSEKGAKVGVETADDVTVVSENGDVVVLEQDKSSIQVKGQPIKDRSNDLWNTLSIWIMGVKNGEFDPQKTTLYFATNKKLPANAVVRKIADADNSLVDDVIQLLKSAIKSPPIGIKEKVEHVLSEEEYLRKIIPCIKLSEDNNPDNLDNDIADRLHLIPETSADVLLYLKGWVHDCITKLWNDQKPGIIDRDSFDTILDNSRFAFKILKIRERVKRLVQKEIKDELKKENQDALFVKQLEEIATNDNEIMVEAIDDYLCAVIERTRLILAGEVTKNDFADFDDKCIGRWKEVKHRNIRRIDLLKTSSDMSEEDKEKEFKGIGFDIYDQTACTGYCGILASYQTTEPYITKGTFYILSDVPIIGWHPKWQDKFMNEQTNENT